MYFVPLAAQGNTANAALNQAVLNETNRASAVEQSLATQITGETARATAVEAGQAVAMSALEQSMAAFIAILSMNATTDMAETFRAIAAEMGLQAAIDLEVSRAKAAEAVEASIARAAESAINAASEQRAFRSAPQ